MATNNQRHSRFLKDFVNGNGNVVTPVNTSH